MKNTIVAVMDVYRCFARRHPVCFICVNMVLVLLWVGVIMHFSGEDADVSGRRSSSILVGIIHAMSPSSEVTVNGYDYDPVLINAERVVRKIAHMIEYGILSILIRSLLFGFASLPRVFAYVLPVIGVACLGVVDEMNQRSIPGRYGSLFDVSVDITASVITMFIVYRLTERYRCLKRENNNPCVRTGS
ncbi:MAG: VanZ family protein [Lachnospiraceae bacterium]|nr:VanZ family protein [Lachnospiraceae bacterium]